MNFSDLLRACLLCQHGGLWIDATVMLTGGIPFEFTNRPLFCYATTPQELRGVGTILASSWFIHSYPKHAILSSVKDMLLEYWKHEQVSVHHYLFHLFFSLSVSSNSLCQDEWARVPFYSNVPPHVLQMELFRDFNSDRFEAIKKMSPVHKLTYYGGVEFDASSLSDFRRK